MEEQMSVKKVTKKSKMDFFFFRNQHLFLWYTNLFSIKIWLARCYVTIEFNERTASGFNV